MTPAGEKLAELIQNLCEKSIGSGNLFQHYCKYKNKLCYIVIYNLHQRNDLCYKFGAMISLVLKNKTDLPVLSSTRYMELNELIKVLEDFEMFQYENETYPISKFNPIYNKNNAEFANIFAEFK